MALLKRSDLNFDYSWSAVGRDNPKEIGSPDQELLNRQEGYEVLGFLNALAEEHGLNKFATLEIEEVIHTKVPSSHRTRANIVAWLRQHSYL